MATWFSEVPNDFKQFKLFRHHNELAYLQISSAVKVSIINKICPLWV